MTFFGRTGISLRGDCTRIRKRHVNTLSQQKTLTSNKKDLEAKSRVLNFSLADVSRGETKEKNMHLESWSFKYAEKFVEGNVTSMILTKQESNSACTLGISFGFSGNKVWVDKGARGWFNVKYTTTGSGIQLSTM